MAPREQHEQIATPSSFPECGDEDEAGFRVAGEAHDFARGKLDRTQPPADVQNAFNSEDLAAGGPDGDVGGEEDAEHGHDGEPADGPWTGFLCDGEAGDDARESRYGQRSYDVGRPLDGCLGKSHSAILAAFGGHFPEALLLDPAFWGHVA